MVQRQTGDPSLKERENDLGEAEVKGCLRHHYFNDGKMGRAFAPKDVKMLVGVVCAAESSDTMCMQ